MPRVKRGTSHVKKRRKLHKATKGYKWGRKNTIKVAKTAVTKAGAHAYMDRRKKKRTTRRLWQVQLNAAVREHDMSYSQFIGALKKKNIELDRKVLAQIAQEYPAVFAVIVETVKK
ncbi:MAG: 50S ribosomal protein L20 [Candidatus Komeilibacteria bacterium]|nr:50S ribosomal protein L20 [Candidatus Komeilibacteria bacterium]